MIGTLPLLAPYAFMTCTLNFIITKSIKLMGLGQKEGQALQFLYGCVRAILW
jgi:hypothetical protein